MLVEHSGGRLSGGKSRKGRACTDVSGLGLIGPLGHLLASNSVDAVVYLDTLPLLDGAARLAAEDVQSSLYAQNRVTRETRQLARADPGAAAYTAWPLLFDRQTAGGLLAALPAHQAGQCVGALRQAGYRHAALIGHLTDRVERSQTANSAQVTTHIRVSSAKPVENQEFFKVHILAQYE